jgi:hypothetical protein
MSWYYSTITNVNCLLLNEIVGEDRFKLQKIDSKCENVRAINILKGKTVPVESAKRGLNIAVTLSYLDADIKC